MSIAAHDPAGSLEVPRGTIALLVAAVRTLAGRPAPFLAATALVVVPTLLLVDGIAGGQLTDGADAHPDEALTFVLLPLVAVILPALVTALHCALVRDLLASRPARLGSALRAVRPQAASALGAVSLYTLAVAAGLALLLAPGVWIAVRLYFGAQAAVLDDLRAFEALQRSASLVQGRWWATAWKLLVCWLATAAVGFPAGHALDALALPPAAHVALSLALQCALLSVAALYGTLLFLALRADRQ
jgi:hypothetical protein